MDVRPTQSNPSLGFAPHLYGVLHTQVVTVSDGSESPQPKLEHLVSEFSETSDHQKIKIVFQCSVLAPGAMMPFPTAPPRSSRGPDRVGGNVPHTIPTRRAKAVPQPWSLVFRKKHVKDRPEVQPTYTTNVTLFRRGYEQPKTGRTTAHTVCFFVCANTRGPQEKYRCIYSMC